MTSILIDAESPAEDKSGGKDTSPLESQRFWERQAEDNAIERLQRIGLLAPPGEVDKVIERAMAIDNRPVVLDFVVHKDAMVWPMVAAGTSNNDIKFARGLAPDWGGSDD